MCIYTYIFKKKNIIIKKKKKQTKNINCSKRCIYESFLNIVVFLLLFDFKNINTLIDIIFELFGNVCLIMIVFFWVDRCGIYMADINIIFSNTKEFGNSSNVSAYRNFVL